MKHCSDGNDLLGILGFWIPSWRALKRRTGVKMDFRDHVSCQTAKHLKR